MRAFSYDLATRCHIECTHFTILQAAYVRIRTFKILTRGLLVGLLSLIDNLTQSSVAEAVRKLEDGVMIRVYSANSNCII